MENRIGCKVGSLSKKRLQHLKVTYGIALAFIALTMLGSSFMMQYSIYRTKGDSRVINLSGRQRMLSQRLTKCVLALERTAGGDWQGRLQELSESLTAWKAAHLGLQFGNEKLGLPVPESSAEIRALFGEIAPFYASMAQSLDELLTQGAEQPQRRIQAAAEVMLRNEPRFLELMDKITFQFDMEAKERILSMQNMDRGILCLGLLVLLLEFLLVFRPSLAQLAEHSEALLNVNAQLQLSIERAKELAAKAEAADRAKSEFLAVMSHELRTPLNGVLGFAELLTFTPLNDQQKRYAQTISKSGGNLLAIVDDILDFSSIETGTLAMETEEVPLAELMGSADLAMRKTAEDKGLEFRCEVDPGATGPVVGDRRRILQILTNLLGNAIKFTSRGSVILRAAASSAGGMPALDFTVEDTGLGISREILDRLFMPFTQADSTVSRPFGGTGLGLAISQRLAGAMGGKISVSSQPGKGSTFTLRLPLANSPLALRAST